MIRVAVLDDYQRVAGSMADWSSLDGRAEVDFFHEHLGTPDDVVARLRPYDVVCLMRERTAMPAAVIDALPRLRLLVTTGMGNAAVDIEAARIRGVVVCGTRMSGPDTPELAWLLIATLLKGFLDNATDVRAGGWQRSVGRRLEGATLGLLGIGNVGGAVARYARAFGMNLLAWSQNMTPALAHAHQATYVTRDELFELSDVVSIHVRLSERSRGLVTAHHLALLGADSYLVNTSRGPIVIEDDLLAALQDGTIAGAGLDTFDREPLPIDHPLRTAPRALLTPHIAYATRESYQEAYTQTVEAIEAWLTGAPIRRID